MATYFITSDPKPSSRNTNYHFVYYGKPAKSGGECMAIFPSYLAKHVKKGDVIDDEQTRYDTALSATVLELDFEHPSGGELSLPAGENGWSDPDALTALEPADAAVVAVVAENAKPNPIPGRAYSPKAQRRADAAARAAEHNLDLELLTILDQACSAFNYACRRIGTAEKPRAMEAQKLATTALIPWLKSRGVALSEDDEKAMSF